MKILEKIQQYRQRLNDEVAKIPVAGEILTTDVKSLVYATLVGIGLLGTPNYANAANVDAEVSASQESAGLDVKVAGKAEPFKLFFRYITSGTARDDVSPTTIFADAKYDLGNGLEAVARTHTVGNNVTPRAGIGYGAKSGDLSGYTQATASAVEGPDGQWLPNGQVYAVGNYTPSISDNVNARLSLENLSTFNQDGNMLSIQNGRAGFDHKSGYGAGIGFKAVEQGPHISVRDAQISPIIYARCRF
ncbi:hypothetical protein ACFL0W_06710 [Nanoarchaeota archaeon]